MTSMRMISKIFVDTNVHVALLDINDSTHTKALEISKLLDRQGSKLYTSSDVIGEALTVISHKLGKKLALEFLSDYRKSNIQEIFINDDLHNLARKFF